MWNDLYYKATATKFNEHIVFEHELIYKGTQNPFGTWNEKEF